MKIQGWNSRFTALAIVVLVFASSCKKDDEENIIDSGPEEEVITLATLTTDWVGEEGSIGQKEWRTTSTITDNGGEELTSRGICWATNEEPVISGDKAEDNSGTISTNNEFRITITGLEVNTTYWFRAYAVNSAGVAYGNAYELTTKQEDGIESTVKDIEGNTYKTVTINGNEWMAENLRVTKLNDGTPIALETGSWDGMTTPLYTYYDNDKAQYEDPYGALYNHYAIETEKLCPTGWHVSTNMDWFTLTIGYWEFAKEANKMKEAGTAHFKTTTTEVDNESKLTLLPGGYSISGVYLNITEYGNYWQTFNEPQQIETRIFITDRSSSVQYNLVGENAGYSVRCVKD